MTQNRSPAVMAQRAEPRHSLDDFPTPPWGTRALVEHVIKTRGLRLGSVWEPAANRGYMARPLAESFERVAASDVHDYGCGYPVSDFLWPGIDLDIIPTAPEWVITNPPFRLAEQFIEKARAVALVGCAMLVRLSFLETVGRYHRLFSVSAPTIIAQFVERLPMVKGRCDPEADSASAYCWLVWVRRQVPGPFQWIPPCRDRLERAGDYQTGCRQV